MSREYREERLERMLQEQLYENVQGTQEAVIVTTTSACADDKRKDQDP